MANQFSIHSWDGTDISTFASLTFSEDRAVDGAAYERREREREMIPKHAVLTANKEEATAMREAFMGLPKLTKQEEELLGLYDAITSGDKVVVLDKILKEGKFFGGSRSWDGQIPPAIALAPVGAKEVRWRAKSPRNTRMGTARFESWVGPVKYTTKRRGEVIASYASATTRVPVIAPQHRDKVQKGDLILWEATWSNVDIKVDRHPDPAILRKVSDGLYRVVAAWDLTAVEAAMLAG